MFLAFAISVSVIGGLQSRVVQGLLLGAGVLMVVGLIDDLMDISPPAKVAGQLAGAVAVVGLASPFIDLPLILTVASVPWMVLIANSVNLLDNMDGLAGGTSVASLVVVLPVVMVAGQDGLALVGATAAGAVLGFLVYNIHPARVFMGDAGSLWLGLVLGALVAFADYGGGEFSPLVVVTMLAVPLLDTATVVFSRLREGSSIMRGGRDHLSHRLVRLGLSDKQAVGLLSGAALLCGLAAISGSFLPTSVWLIAVALVWGALVVLAATLLRVPMYQG